MMTKQDVVEAVRTVRCLQQELALDAEGTLQPLGLNLNALISLTDEAATGNRSAQARSIGRLYYLYGWSVQEIAKMAGITESDVEDAVARSPRSSASSTVLRLHGEGRTVNEIRYLTGIERGSIYRWLTDAGLKPNRHSKHYSAEDYKRAGKLYEAGYSYGQIATEMGLDRSRAAGLVRTAAHKGLVPSYGTRS